MGRVADIRQQPGDNCPVCDKPSTLVRDLDRYVHEDGSSNVSCWGTITRGEV